MDGELRDDEALRLDHRRDRFAVGEDALAVRQDVREVLIEILSCAGENLKLKNSTIKSILFFIINALKRKQTNGLLRLYFGTGAAGKANQYFI